MSDEAAHPYTPAYYEKHQKGASQSASLVWDFLFQHYRPNSILDVGCGSGEWLKEAQVRGVKKLVGLDGAWVQNIFKNYSEIGFIPANLEEDLPVVEPGFELAVCLEVAEHLSSKQGHALVKFLCHASDIILFGAAIPGQEGEHHINEQWPQYWERLFETQGYTLIDCIRPHLWNQSKVKWWYRQNTFVYIHTKRQNELSQKLLALQKPIIDLVSPELLAKKLAQLTKDKEVYALQLQWPDRVFLFKVFYRWLKIKWNQLFTWFSRRKS